MPKCVEIELEDDGTFKVGECDPKTESPEGEGAADTSGEQTFNTFEQAAAAAKQILTSTEGTQANQQMRQEVAGQVWPKKPSTIPQGMA